MEKTMTRIFWQFVPEYYDFPGKHLIFPVFPLQYIKALNTKPVPTVNCYNNVSGYISSGLRLCQNCLNFNSQNIFFVHYLLLGKWLHFRGIRFWVHYLNASNRSINMKLEYWYPHCTYYWSFNPQLSDTVFAKFEAFHYFCNEFDIRVNVSINLFMNKICQLVLAKTYEI